MASPSTNPLYTFLQPEATVYGTAYPFVDDPGNFTSGTFTVDTNKCRITTGGTYAEMAWKQQFPADQESWMTVDTVSTATDAEYILSVRVSTISSPGNADIYYGHWVKTTGPTWTLNIIAYDASVPSNTVLGTEVTGSNATVASGDQLCVTVTGSSNPVITVYKNGVQVHQATDTGNLITGPGYIDFGVYESSGTVSRITPFGGGEMGRTFPYVAALGTFSASTDASAPYTVPAGGTFSLPTHQANDILVIAACKNNGADLTIDGSWAAIVSAQNNANLSTAWWWLRASSGSTTAPTITSSTTGGTSAGIYARCFVIRGCVTTGTPFEDATVNGTPTSSSTPTTSTITTVGPNRLAAWLALIDDNNTVSSWTSDWASITAIGSDTGGDGQFQLAVQHKATAGDVTGGTIMTMGAADYWRTLALAFLPPPTPSLYVAPNVRRQQHILVR